MPKMVKIRALRPFFGTYGKVAKDQVVEVSESHARKYEQRGIAVSADFKGKVEAPLKNKEATVAVPLENKETPDHPGGQSGKAKPWLSSEEAPAQDKSTSAKSKK